MKLERFGEIAAQSAIGIAILVSFGAVLFLACVMGALLVPYNIARSIAWIFEKLIGLLAFVIAAIEERI